MTQDSLTYAKTLANSDIPLPVRAALARRLRGSQLKPLIANLLEAIATQRDFERPAYAERLSTPTL